MPRFCFPAPNRSAAALSIMVHVTVAILVLWRGAVFLESSSGGDRGLRGGSGGVDRPAISWVALPAVTSPPIDAPPVSPPGVTVPIVVPPRIERLTLASPHVMAVTLPTPLPAPVSTDQEWSAGNGPDSGGGRASRNGSGSADTGAGSGGGASGMFAGDIFGPTPLLVPKPPAGAPPDDKRKHDVRFWIRTDGRVTRIAVSPPIRDSDYRRRFMEAMSDIVFDPVKTRDGRPIDYVYSIVVNP